MIAIGSAGFLFQCTKSDRECVRGRESEEESTLSNKINDEEEDALMRIYSILHIIGHKIYLVGMKTLAAIFLN